MPETFYDKVAKKFGVSGPRVNRIMEYPGGDPEDIFEQKLFELSGNGKFTLRMAAHFRQIIGIDFAEERLKHAQAEQQAQGNNNVRFEKQDARQTTFAHDTFDIVYTRRGPTFYREYYRIAKSGGYVLTIGIGERDAWELKRIFGRGQGFREWKISALEQSIEQLQHEGFSVVYGQGLLYDEYYASYQDLNLFLQGVPIFEDFDSDEDRSFLEAYMAAFQTDRGIHLPRHRYITVAVKP